MPENSNFNKNQEKFVGYFNKILSVKIIIPLLLLVIIFNYILTQKTTWLYNLVSSDEVKQFTVECKKIGMDEEVDLNTTETTDEGLHTFKFCKDKNVYIKNPELTIYYRSVCDLPIAVGRRNGSICHSVSISENGNEYPNNDSSQYTFKFKSNFWSGDMVVATVKKNY